MAAMMPAGSGHLSTNRLRGPTSGLNPIVGSPSASAPTSIAREISLSSGELPGVRAPGNRSRRAGDLHIKTAKPPGLTLAPTLLAPCREWNLAAIPQVQVRCGYCTPVHKFAGGDDLPRPFGRHAGLCVHPHAAYLLAMLDLLARWVETCERLDGSGRSQMNHLVALDLELFQKQGNRCGRGGVNIMEQDDAAPVLLKRGHHSVDDAGGVAAAPIE